MYVYQFRNVVNNDYAFLGEIRCPMFINFGVKKVYNVDEFNDNGAHCR